MKKMVLAALCSGSFAVIVTLGLRTPAVAPPAPETEPLPEAAPAGPVDGSPEAAYGYALAREKAGDLAAAAEYYLKALELDPTYSAARSKVLSMPEALKAHEERRINAHVLALFTRLLDEKRDREAQSIAPLVLRMNPENERAHVLVGDVQIAGQWYSKDEAEVVRIARAKTEEIEAYERLPLRGKKLYSLRQEYDSKWSLGKDDRAWLDCAPYAPFVLCLEKSDSYSANVLLEGLRAQAQAWFGQFCKEFGGVFSPEVLCADEVCPVYVFSTQARYRTCTEAPDFMVGHFDARLGVSFLPYEAGTFLESLFHEFTHQLVHAISGVKRGAPLVPAETQACWFLEGITTYEEGFRFGTDGKLEFCVPPGGMLAAAKKQLASPKRHKLEELMQVSFRELKRNAGRQDRGALLITAECWAATYFLLNFDGGKYRDSYLEYFKLELIGKGGFDAAKRCFGDPGALDAEWVDYVRGMK